MYNNIGLRTPRGSGTNGFIQKNLANLPPSLQTMRRNAMLVLFFFVLLCSFLSFFFFSNNEYNNCFHIGEEICR